MIHGLAERVEAKHVNTAVVYLPKGCVLFGHDLRTNVIDIALNRD